MPCMYVLMYGVCVTFQLNSWLVGHAAVPQLSVVVLKTELGGPLSIPLTLPPLRI